MSSLSTDTRLSQVAALEAELQSLVVKFSDHRNDSRWHRGIATAFTAKLCIHASYRLPMTGNSAVESLEQRRKTSLELLDLLADISNSALYLHPSTAVFPSPFAIVALFLTSNAMASLDAVGGDTYLLGERQTFIQMLQRFSRRWRIARRLSEILEQA
ncbi:hypothetical protein FE257_001786 [Aspergillus nanangensis]|uniref:Uncharacterized protein n=1 Tax=Aspergillus nanangensis TaxID=2582783 RepID=A0AAD4CDC0_ASPNN|nr:hypothetical protein FE257_001786 [Aspergillus nanangensis]